MMHATSLWLLTVAVGLSFFITNAHSTDKNKTESKQAPLPVVYASSKEFLEGESFSINCTATYERGNVVNLHWEYPENIPKGSNYEETNSYDNLNGSLYVNITIVNATKAHAGKYTCISSNSGVQHRKSVDKIYLKEPLLKIKRDREVPIESWQAVLDLTWEVQDYPPAQFRCLKNNKPISTNGPHYTLKSRRDNGDPILEIKPTSIYDTANYTLIASNKYMSKNSTVDVRIAARPNITYILGKNNRYLVNTIVSFKCEVIGYPKPEIKWIFSNGKEEQSMEPTELVTHSLYKFTAYYKTKVRESGNLTCAARNTRGNDSVTQPLLMYDIYNGFGIEGGPKTWVPQNENVTLKCLASIYDFRNVTWLGSGGEFLGSMVNYTRTSSSYVAILKIDRITLDQSGNYTCQGTRLNGTEVYDPNPISVAGLRPPVIRQPIADTNQENFLKQKVDLTCQADGVPLPTLIWYKDDKVLENSSNVHVFTTYVNNTIINSTIVIDTMQERDVGTYECMVTTSTNTEQQSRFYFVSLKEDVDYTMYLSGIAVIILALILIVVYLMWKVKKEKKFRKELAAAGLLYFKEGVTKSLNPDLGIDEQAELLPYDEKFEFPPEKLKFGKQLGAGAFGVVYKAEARGIIDAEETTEVAVKTVKKTADNMFIKALASELKIMVHLGKHVNIVNLLGACTKNVGKRELVVIVEYCKFGNIHNYMQRHREVFIDQLTDNKEKYLGKVNKGFLNSTGSAGAHSDYFSTANTQDTDHTFVNTANSQRSERKVSEGYIQPEWRSNYDSDYNYDYRNPRPLTSRDLLAWAFQIARGMEYLASRKVLHGDLAARNVLLAEDNVVKICDFGLARSIYKNDEYQKKENSPLPVKWLAIECMADRIFSTQSDVWSFGIVLWELFSLAKTPYPNIDPPSLVQCLTKGYRLEKPPYADDRIYEIMKRCWQHKPTARPSFTELQEILGTFLEDNVRNHYVDLNSSYMVMNTQKQGEQDYLDMVCAPDYNNLVTPSPHHYANVGKSFFPTTPVPLAAEVKNDEDGYLQMSPATNKTIFSPRPQNATFDFDARKFNPRVSEASSGGSELTPMLTLNNLPARSGSESDHEGNTFPYLNVMHSRIEEESDEVFETKQNNAKNLQNNIAISNPTYALNDDIKKKPNDIINSYVNVNIPNGLVK